MRGHKADRCWQKGKGKGGKGGWETGQGGSKGKGWPKRNRSNSGYTWDNSWHHSNWHGKTYGLAVDPWTAVEPIPYLCAVSLNSSCGDSSEPKRMSRGRHTKISQPESPKDFAHVNFSILASDDNKSTGECCISIHTSRVQCQQRRYDDERDDGCIEALETKVSCHQQGSGSSKSSACHVSYFPASGGDSKGVHHVRESGWTRFSAVMDSGSAECVAREDIAKNIPSSRTDLSHSRWRCYQEQGGKDCDDVLRAW